MTYDRSTPAGRTVEVPQRRLDCENMWQECGWEGTGIRLRGFPGGPSATGHSHGHGSVMVVAWVLHHVRNGCGYGALMRHESPQASRNCSAPQKRPTKDFFTAPAERVLLHLSTNDCYCLFSNSDGTRWQVVVLPWITSP